MSNFVSNKKAVLAAKQAAERRALEGIGVFVDGEAVLRAPVDTGNLRSSINHRVNEKEKTVTIGTPVEYAPYVELGTSNMGKQPFLEPSVMQNKRRIGDLAKKLLKF